MKCPKCGYNSFDYLETCKKCGTDLSEHKTRFGLRSLFFPDRGSQHSAEARAPHSAAELPLFAEAVPFDLGSPDDDQKPAPAAGENDDPLPEPPAAPDAPADEPFEEWPLFSEDQDDPAPAAEEFSLLEEPQAEDEEPQQASELFAAEPPEHPAPADEPFGEWPLFSEEEESSEPVADPFADETAAGDSVETPPQFAGEAEPESAGDDETSFFQNGEELAGAGEPPAPWPPERHDADAGEGQAVDIEDFSASPADEGVAVEETQCLRVAFSSQPSAFSRLGASVADLVVLAVTFALFLWVGNAAYRAGGAALVPPVDVVLTMAVPYFLVLFGLCFGYFMFFHFLTGQTPGKMLFGLRVEGEEGEALLLSQAFLRSVGGLLALLCLGLGFVPVLGKRRRGWNDMLAGTRLVRAKDEVPAEEA